ncbi:MAG: CAP domain-containing protein [Actinobacteria bacterium]|nr:CAP domain-containing protein [Actinomycetota bacterium]
MQKLRKLFVAGAALLVALSLVAEGAAAEGLDPVSAEHEFVGRLNDLRAAHGLNSLSVDPALTDVARNWASRMAAVNQISHRSDLAAVAPANWLVLGENVGAGPAVAPIHDALVASPSHYANLVDPRFRQVGVGVVVVGGKIFVAQNFMTAEAPAAVKACKGRRCKSVKGKAVKRKSASKRRSARRR